MALLKHMKPRMAVKDRRITITLTLLPESLDLLDRLSVTRGVSRGRIVDDLIASCRKSAGDKAEKGGRAAS